MDIHVGFAPVLRVLFFREHTLASIQVTRVLFELPIQTLVYQVFSPLYLLSATIPHLLIACILTGNEPAVQSSFARQTRRDEDTNGLGKQSPNQASTPTTSGHPTPKKENQLPFFRTGISLAPILPRSPGKTRSIFYYPSVTLIDIGRWHKSTRMI